MVSAVRRLLIRLYERSLISEIADPPSHVAIIQDGNRRFARKEGQPVTEGHRAGAETTEAVLQWCQDIGIEELTVYAFSTENFSRPASEREHLFDLLTEKLETLADEPDIHENEVRIKTIGEVERLPRRVQNAIQYAERRTQMYDAFRLNIAVAYGGRAELLTAARSIANAVENGEIAPEDVDIDQIDAYLYDADVADVDLIIRTGGDERTSNFLPWHANGNEAAVCFCTPYWPEFSKRDFLRALRTYQYREQRWQTTRVQRAVALLRGLGDHELPHARAIVSAVRAEEDEAVDLNVDSDMAD